MYWRISSFPEFEHLSERERGQLLRDQKVGRTTTGLIVRAFCAGGVAGLLTAIMLDSLSSTGWPALLTALTVPMYTVLAFQFQMIRIRGSLRKYLEEESRHRPLPLCLNCGYSLKALPGNRCPECGVVI